MIQRIQTVYMLVSAVLLGLLFALPFADVAFNGEFYRFDIRGMVLQNTVLQSGLPVALFTGLIVLLHLAAILLYKKRILQIRLLIFSILLMLGLFGLFYFFTCYSFRQAEISFRIAVAFPLVAVILDYLAIRNIGKDEALVRSIDRIR
ncbi:MAG: DUF4293 domain-containing protein [Mangrovibacterium sp.]